MDGGGAIDILALLLRALATLLDDHKTLWNDGRLNVGEKTHGPLANHGHNKEN